MQPQKNLNSFSHLKISFDLLPKTHNFTYVNNTCMYGLLRNHLFRDKSLFIPRVGAQEKMVG